MQYEETGEFPVERGYIWTTCASVENGNPLFWDDDVAAEITDGPIAPPTMLSVWFRPHHWAPGRTEQALPLQVHFDLKERFDLPEAIMTDNTIVFHEPVRLGDVITTLPAAAVGERREDHEARHRPVLGDRRRVPQPARRARSASSRTPASATARGGMTARDSLDDVAVGDALPPLSYDVTATTVVLGALASRDWRPMHHDHDFAVNRNGTQRHLPEHARTRPRGSSATSPTGPGRRAGSGGMTFRMKGSVFPGDTMVLAGTVHARRDRRRRLRLGRRST